MEKQRLSLQRFFYIGLCIQICLQGVVSVSTSESAIMPSTTITVSTTTSTQSTTTPPQPMTTLVTSPPTTSITPTTSMTPTSPTTSTTTTVSMLPNTTTIESNTTHSPPLSTNATTAATTTTTATTSSTTIALTTESTTETPTTESTTKTPTTESTTETATNESTSETTPITPTPTTPTSPTSPISTQGPPPETTPKPAGPDQGVMIGAIAGGVVGGILIFAFCGFVIFRFRKTGSLKKIFIFKEGPTYVDPGPDVDDQRKTTVDELASFPRSIPIKISELPDQYLDMSRNSSLVFRQQYSMLSRLSPNLPKTASQLAENTDKNRYRDILPFDHNRVKLSKLEDDEFSDYVNASFVPGYRSEQEYIACQGPTEETVNDHWRMIWEQNIRVIVMVTKCEEGELIKREKCIQYWPDKESSQLVFGGITVGLLSSEKHCRDNYRIRKLDVRNGVETRIVYHFQYLRWPDKQNPEDPEGMLEYRESIRDTMIQFDSGPIVVHCSAGVGRSGTYIAIDTLLQHVEDHDYVDVYGLILKLRKYRVYLVQTPDQYMFVFHCLLLNMDNKRKQEVDDGNLYVNVMEDEYNPYENIPMARKPKEERSIFSSGVGKKRKSSKIKANSYMEVHAETELSKDKDLVKPPKIPSRKAKDTAGGHENLAMTTSEDSPLTENGTATIIRDEATEANGNVPDVISETSVTLEGI